MGAQAQGCRLHRGACAAARAPVRGACTLLRGAALAAVAAVFGALGVAVGGVCFAGQCFWLGCAIGEEKTSKIYSKLQ